MDALYLSSTQSRSSMTYEEYARQRQLKTTEYIDIGDFGVAKHDDKQQWYRARVIMCEGHDLIRIVFIDFGCTTVKAIHEFFPIDKEFTVIPAQAIACTLSEVETNLLTHVILIDVFEFLDVSYHME
jgi:hypothetical protein